MRGVSKSLCCGLLVNIAIAVPAQAQLLSLGDVDLKVDVLSTEVAELQTELDQTSLDVDLLGADVLAIEVDLGALRTEVDANAVAIAANTALVSDLDARVSADLAALSGIVAINSAALADAGADLPLVSGDATSLDAQIAVDLAALGGRIDSQDTTIATLDSRVTSNGEAVSALRTDVDAHTQAIAANTATNIAQGAAIGENAGRIAANRVAIGDNTARIAGHGDAIAAIVETNRVQDGAIARNAAGLASNAQALADLTGDIVDGRIGMVRMGADQTVLIASDRGGTVVAFEGSDGPRRLTGVADGIADGDAATVGQMRRSDMAMLQGAMNYTDRSMAAVMDDLDRMWARLDDTRSELNSEIDRASAGTAALAGLPQAMVPGKGMVVAGVGGRREQAAVALGIGKAFDSPNMPVLRAGVAMDLADGTATYNAAVGIHF